MKICILGDTHFGARKASKVFSQHFEKFYTEFFFPYLRTNKIKNVLQLGDLFDERPQINFQALEDAKRYFFDSIVEEQIDLDVLVGNHDAPYKQTIRLNSPSLLLQEYKSINIIENPSTLTFGKCKILAIPWICKENYDECVELLNSSTAPICIGHFDIQGFEMFKGSIESKHGLKQSIFERFEWVWSGHFHTRSRQGNIIYTGTPYEMCWSDFNDPKGFHIFDTDSHKLEFVENPFTIHEKYLFQAGEEAPTDVAGKYIKLFIEGSYDPIELDRWSSHIESQGPADFKRIETNVPLSEIMNETSSIENVENYSILDIAKENIVDDSTIRIFNDIYLEALALNDSI